MNKPNNETLTELLELMAIAAARLLFERSDGDEDKDDWGSLRDALEPVIPLVPEEYRHLLERQLDDFDHRLSIKMIGRP